MRRYFALAVLATAFTVTPAARVTAQGIQAGLSYDWSMPVGDLKNYIDNDSWLGFTLDVRKKNPTGSFTWGATFGYLEFYQAIPGGSAATVVFPQGAITGQQYHHLFSFPMMLSAAHYFGSDSRGMRPYVGLSAGVTYLKQTVDVGVYTLESDAWKPAAMPELGLSWSTPRRTQVNLHVRYHYAAKADGMYTSAAPGASMQYLSIGIGFMGRVF